MSHRRKIVAAVLFSTAVALPAASVAKPPPDAQVAPELLALRSKLAKTSRAEATQRMQEFRPLCDADGYPLVGNLATKVSPTSQPSAFCATVRETEGQK